MKKASGFKMKNPSIAKLAKAAGSTMKLDPTKLGTKESLTKPKKRSFDEAYEKRDMKLYGGLNKADYIKEAKRQKSVKESKVLKKGATLRDWFQKENWVQVGNPKKKCGEK